MLASVGCATPNTGENREETNAKAPETTQYNAQETTLRIQKLLADNGTTLTDDLINNVSPYDEKNKFMKLLLEVNNVFGNSGCSSPISVVYSAVFSPAAAASSVF